MFYLLHGDDEFSSREQLKKLRQQGNFEYNQDTFNGVRSILRPSPLLLIPCHFLLINALSWLKDYPRSGVERALLLPQEMRVGREIVVQVQAARRRKGRGVGKEIQNLGPALKKD